MTDSTYVFSPGDRIIDPTTGYPASGAVIRFYDAGTTAEKTVYADSDLSVTLGTSVTTDSAGYPTSDGATKTLIYVGPAAYKVRIERSDATEIVTHDNVKGAVEVFNPGDLSVVSTTPVETKSLDYTIVADDQSKVFAGNCAGGSITLTLPSAVAVGTGWGIQVEHVATANHVRIATVSSQTISSGATVYGARLTLTRSGESVRLVSDGGNWRAASHTPPHIKGGQGVVNVADILSTPPGSPAAGDFYILGASPTGAWSAYAQHDIVQYTGLTWVRFTPREGYQVWLADEDRTYRFDGSSWLSEGATSTRPGTVLVGTKANLETETAFRVPSADLAKHLPGMAKVLLKAQVSAGVPTVAYSYNVSSLLDTAIGRLGIMLTDNFVDANWVCLPVLETPATNAPRVANIQLGSQTASSVEVTCNNVGSALTDPASWHIVGYGALA